VSFADGVPTAEVDVMDVSLIVARRTPMMGMGMGMGSPRAQRMAPASSTSRMVKMRWGSFAATRLARKSTASTVPSA